MNDDIRTDELKQNMKSQDTWLRLLFIIIFAVILQLVALVLGFVVIFQFLSVLFTGETQKNLLSFGRSLAEYVREVVAYLTFNSEHKPFPFGEWPHAPGEPPQAPPKKKTAAKKKPAADNGVAS